MGTTLNKAVVVDIMGQLPHSTVPSAYFSHPGLEARSELLQGWDCGSQFPDEATGWGNTRTKGSSGGRGPHLDLMGIGLWNEAVFGGFPAFHCWRHSGPLWNPPMSAQTRVHLGQGSTYPRSGGVRAGEEEL